MYARRHITLVSFNLIGGLGQAGYLGLGDPSLLGAVAGRRIQPGLVSSAPPIYEPAPVVGPTKESMTAAEATAMMKNPAYKQSGGRATGTGAQGTCAHVGLKVTDRWRAFRRRAPDWCR